VSVNAQKIQVLIVEDGNEYLTNLSTFVAAGMSYVQVQSGAAACEIALRERPDVVYLDMRFDRTPFAELLGDMVAATARFNGDVGRARTFLQDNQGLFILRALRDAGYRGPVILSYDFGGEERRFRALSAKDPSLAYCPDYADAATIREAILRAAGRES